MNYQVIYNLSYTNRSVTGKRVNIRKCIDKTHAKTRFNTYSRKKYRNAKDITITDIIELKESENDDVNRLMNLFGM